VRPAFPELGRQPTVPGAASVPSRRGSRWRIGASVVPGPVCSGVAPGKPATYRTAPEFPDVAAVMAGMLAGKGLPQRPGGQVLAAGRAQVHRISMTDRMTEGRLGIGSAPRERTPSRNWGHILLHANKATLQSHGRGDQPRHVVWTWARVVSARLAASTPPKQ
jgi:hypothetical protein